VPEGTYDVFAWWTDAPGRPADVAYEIAHAAGTATVANVSQQTAGSHWNLLGTYGFAGSARIRLHSGATGTEGTCADAVRFVRHASVVREVRIASGQDDAEEHPDGTVDLTGAELELTQGTHGNQVVGLRFAPLRVPHGVRIKRAYVEFQVAEPGSDATALTIQGQAAGHARSFAGGAADLTSRPLTDASVPWSPEPWTVTGAAGVDQRSPDLAPVIEEILDRPDWLSGNALALLIHGTGSRVAESYEGAPAAAPLLYVEFVAGPEDPDGDGLPDAWERDWFGGTDEAGGAPEEDYDGDRFVNIAEFIAGTDPTDPLSYFHMTGWLTQPSTDDLVISWPSVGNRVYHVNSCSNLLTGPWTNVLDATNLPGTGETMSWTNRNPAADHCFYRIQVEFTE
jgi:hypothetical protein